MSDAPRTDVRSVQPQMRTEVLRWVQAGALLVALIALALRWALVDRAMSFPPGLVLLAGGALVVLLLRARWTATVGLVVGVVVVVAFLGRDGAKLVTGFGDGLRFGLRWLELLALLVGVGSGVARLLRSPRRGPTSAEERPRDRRWVQVVVLLVLAPVCAEYLAAYDDSTGDPVRLVGGLVVFTPLYGCPALLIREVVRRTGRGWPSILLLGTAFGLLQAGVVDQSLFSTDYRQIAGWEESQRATLIAPLGISAYSALNFLSGHAAYSMAAPIAMAEGIRPGDATRPWLRRRGRVLVALAWVAASVFVLVDSLRTEESHAALGQVVGATLVATGLVVLGLRLPRVYSRLREPTPGHAALPVPLVLLGSAVLSLAYGSAPETWTGVAVMGGALLLAGVGLSITSKGSGWGPQHVAAAAVAPLVVRAALAFGYQPLVGDVSPAAALGHHLTMLLLTLTLLVLVLRPRPGGSGGQGISASLPPG